MKQHFSWKPTYTLMPVLATILVLAFCPAFAQAPSIEGTYRLVSRTLKDGTVLTPPEVIGLSTYTKEYRQFNIASKDADGKIISRSVIATYKLTPTEYTETTLLHILVRGQEVENLSDQSQQAAVTIEGGRITIAPRQSESRRSVYEGSKLTAISPGNTDTWEKVQ